MNRDELAALVLTEVSRQCAYVCERAKPPTWQSWNVREWEDDRELGPKYSPTWFGGVTTTEAGRVRVLRTVYRLADAGLLTILKSEGGRLERVQLTPAGEEAVTELGATASR